MIVGWGAADVFVATFDNEQMAILDTSYEPHMV